MRQTLRPAIQQGQAGRDNRVHRRAKAQFLGERHAQHHAHLRIIGKRMLHHGIDQAIQPPLPPQHLPNDRQRQPRVGGFQFPRLPRGNLIERLPPPINRIQHVERGKAQGHAGRMHGIGFVGVRRVHANPPSRICANAYMRWYDRW